MGLSKFVWGNRSQRVLPSTRKGQLYYDYALSHIHCYFCRSFM
ncbi:MAG TPA: hypothetical protein VFB85_24300 [Vicinamibacterales bacterium]|nr:hypothetical protein [Vicinamibacterales bacterium]